MNFQDMMSQTFVRTREVIPSARLDEGAVAQILNASIQDVYTRAVGADPDFYTKSVALTSSPQTLPADFYKARFIYVGGATYHRARIVDMRTAEFLNASLVQAGVTSDPLAVISGTSIEVTPSATTGTLYYLWKPPIVTTYTTELTVPGNGYLALIPQAYEEDIALNAQRQIMLRLAADGTDALSLGPDTLQQLTTALASLEEQYNPDTIYGMQTQTPVNVPDPRRMVAGQQQG